jgi:hypothetical protein
MRNRWSTSINAIAIAVGIGSIHLASLAAQSSAQGSHNTNAPKSSAKWTPPRTAWGDPDLQGTYTSDNSIGVAFERPPQFAGRTTLNDEEYAARERSNAEQIAKDQSEFPETPFAQDSAANNAPRHWLDRPTKPSRASSLVVEPADGRIPPMTPEGQRLSAERRSARLAHEQDSYEFHSNYDRCITRGVTGSILPVIYGNGTNIMQGPGYVVIRNEMIHEARLVSLDPRPRLGKSILQYMGDPRGHWEGDTVVVESTNFTDNTGLGGNGNGAIHSENLRLTERFTRTDPGTVHYEFTVDDPTMYTRPWKVALDLTTKLGYPTIYEYACHEGNYGMANMLSAARVDEKAAAAVK